MLGKNLLRKPEYDSEGRLRVQSIFRTIQGEGPNAGRPAIFVRLAGCNLRCHFCDTEFDSGWDRLVNPEDASLLVWQARSEAKVNLVVITGGEPMIQNLVPFIHFLRLGSWCRVVQIETAGTVFCPGLEPFLESGFVQLVCSPKSSRINSNVINYCEDWKYIVREGELDDVDGLPAFSTQVVGKTNRLFRPDLSCTTQRIWLQPCDEPGRKNENQAACVASAIKHGYRLSYQIHKALGLE